MGVLGPSSYYENLCDGRREIDCGAGPARSVGGRCARAQAVKFLPDVALNAIKVPRSLVARYEAFHKPPASQLTPSEVPDFAERAIICRD